MRRSGKRYRLLQEMGHLTQAGISTEQMCYFNFEDDCLAPITHVMGDEVLETFFYLHPDALDEGAYLFLGELQELEGWGCWLRRVVDTCKATIYVMGSSSKMLSAEISTELRGRALDFELLPYSFGEYLRAHETLGLVPGKQGIVNSHATGVLVRRRALFDSYLDGGGFPATLGLPSRQATMLLQSYVQRVIARDVIERHDLARPQVVTSPVRRVLSANGKVLSMRNVEASLRGLGMRLSCEYFADVLGYLQEAYLIFSVREFSYALSEKSTSQLKVYAVDSVLALANAKANSLELGQRLENVVYLELRHRHPGARQDEISRLHTKEHGWEVDFVVGDVVEQEPFQLVQVCANADDEVTLRRELRSLWEGMGEGDLREGLRVVGDGSAMTYE